MRTIDKIAAGVVIGFVAAYVLYIFCCAVFDMEREREQEHRQRLERDGEIVKEYDNKPIWL